VNLTGIAFMIAFVACCGLALRRHPVYGAMLYVVMVFVDPPSRWWGESLPDFRWSLLSAAVTMISLVVHKTKAPPTNIFRHGPTRFLLLIVCWAIIQWAWAKDPGEHQNFVTYYIKYGIAIFLIYRSVEEEKHLLWLLRAYVGGCAYLAFVAFTTYNGGRFDSFGGSGIGDANAGALTLATGVFIAGALALRAKRPEQIALALVAMFLVNSMVMTVSRSGFLAIAVGGLAFNFYAPKAVRKYVIGLSVLGAIGFVLLTNPLYWARIATVKYKGADVEGVETGGARRNLLYAQAKMFKEHPLGCGHLCTEYLSPQYLEAKDLSLQSGKRSSHNTFLSFLVDQGILGGVAYALLLAWVLRSLYKLKKHSENFSPFMQSLLPGIGACLGAQFVADQFVPYVRFEVRFWLLTFLMIMLNMTIHAMKKSPAKSPLPAMPTPAKGSAAGPGKNVVTS
jgi:O-antigen ligase